MRWICWKIKGFDLAFYDNKMLNLVKPGLNDKIEHEW